MDFLSAELVADSALWRAAGSGASDSRFETHNVSSRVDGAAGSNPKSAEMRWRGWCGWLRLEARGTTPRRALVRARLHCHSQKWPPKLPPKRPSEKSKTNSGQNYRPNYRQNYRQNFPPKFFIVKTYVKSIFSASA